VTQPPVGEGLGLGEKCPGDGEARMGDGVGLGRGDGPGLGVGPRLGVGRPCNGTDVGRVSGS
jgi:hypothetical protein